MKTLIKTCAMVLIMVIQVNGERILTLEELREMDSLSIPGMKVSQASDAVRIADKMYSNKVRGIMANEGAGHISIITMGYDVPGFCTIGDVLWEVRVHSRDVNGSNLLRSIMWIHPQTENVYFICGPWES